MEKDVSHLRREGVSSELSVAWRFKGKVLPVLAIHSGRLSQLVAPRLSDA